MRRKSGARKSATAAGDGASEMRRDASQATAAAPLPPRARPSQPAAMEEEESASLRPRSLESRSKPHGQGLSTPSSSNPSLSVDVVMPLETVSEEEDDDDNSFDKRDDMSESLPSVDGKSGSEGADEVGDGTSKAKKAKTGGKKEGHSR